MLRANAIKNLFISLRECSEKGIKTSLFECVKNEWHSKLMYFHCTQLLNHHWLSFSIAWIQSSFSHPPLTWTIKLKLVQVVSQQIILQPKQHTRYYNVTLAMLQVSVCNIKTKFSLIPRSIDLKLVLLNPYKPIRANHIDKNQQTK